MYPTMNGKTSNQRSLEDSDPSQTHIIRPGMSVKGKLVNGVSFTLSRYARSSGIYDHFQPDPFRFDQELVHCTLFYPLWIRKVTSLPLIASIH